MADDFMPQRGSEIVGVLGLTAGYVAAAGMDA